MRKFLRDFLAIGLAFVVGSVTILPVATAGEGKVPITTSSSKALEYFHQGKALFDKLRVPDSRVYFEKAVAEDPNFAMGYLYLGFAMPSVKGYFDNLTKAKSVMDKASEAEQWWILGSEAGFVGNPEKQRELYAKMATAYPNDEQAQTQLGNYYFGQQQYEKAIKQYEAAEKANPNFSQIYNQLGYSYRFLEQYDNAEKAFKKYIELIPDDPNPYDSYAEFLMKVGRYEESIDQYRKALKYDPTFAASYIGIATDNNFLGRYDQARKAAQELYENAVNNGQKRGAHFAMAVSYVDEGNLEKAIEEIQKQMAIAQNIDDAANVSGDHIFMGDLYLELNQPDKAMAQYQQATDVVQKSDLSDELKKNNRLNFLFFEGKAALKKGDMAKAKSNQKEYQAAAEAKQNRFQIWGAHQLAGMIALEEKDYKTAVDELKQANLQDMYNLYRLSLAYKGMGDKDGAKKTCSKLVKYNQLNAINYGLVRHKANTMLASL